MLSERLLALRKSRSLSQKEMAELFSVSRQTVVAWEQGATAPSIEKLLAIAQYFDVAPGSLLENPQSEQDAFPAPNYSALHEWENYASQLEIELVQSLEEGKDATHLEGLFHEAAKLPEGPHKQALADLLFQMLEGTGQRSDYPYEEPSSYPAISALAAHAAAVPCPGETVMRKKLLGALLGRVCGCLLGKSVEGMRLAELTSFLKETGNYPMRRYILRSDFNEGVAARYSFPLLERCYADTIRCAPADDDTNYTIMAQLLVERHGRNFAPKNVADLWLALQPKNAYCTAERVAFRNFVNGYLPPDSARYKNPYREWIGAQIRGDYFGYINAGNPAAAAEMAWRDASISHVKNGIYGEMFIAAMIAKAAVSSDIKTVLEAGLAEIPPRSRLAEKIRLVMQEFEAGKDFDALLEIIYSFYDDRNPHHWCHTISNAMIVAAALLCSGQDYGRSICLAVQAGFDTDCNGATVGSVLGMMLGEDGIPETWAAPVHGRLETDIFGVSEISLKEAAETTLKHLYLSK